MHDSKTTGIFPQLGYGLGLRSDHYSEVLEGRSSVSWFEVISESFMEDGGRPLFVLDKIRQDFAIALHGVSLSIGSVDPLNRSYLKKLKNLMHRVQPALVSDHCCWTGVAGENLHDLMPLPFTEEAVRHIASRISQVQDFLGCRLLIENVSSYLSFRHSEMSEWEFLSEISNRSDCGLLLDVNNIYVSSINHGFDPLEFLRGIPAHRVGQIHLAGHSTCYTPSGEVYLIDTHDHPVCPEVWSLYEQTIRALGKLNTMVEWDAEIPPYAELEAEVRKAQKIEENLQRHGITQSRHSSELVSPRSHEVQSEQSG